MWFRRRVRRFLLVLVQEGKLMYRPNRVGPWPLVHVDQTVSNTGALPAGNTHFETEFEPSLPDSVIRSASASEYFFGLTNAAVPALESVSIGVAVNGAHPLSELEGNAGDPGYLLSVSGSCKVRIPASTQIGIEAVIGRATAATLTSFGSGNNPCASHFVIPCAIAQGDGFSQAWVNTTVVMGNYNGAITVTSNPLIFGFRMTNYTGANAQWRWFGGMSVHKYIQDLNTFDPTRV